MQGNAGDQRGCVVAVAGHLLEPGNRSLRRDHEHLRPSRVGPTVLDDQSGRLLSSPRSQSSMSVGQEGFQ